MAIEDQQQQSKMQALAAMAAGQDLGPDPIQEAQQAALQTAARNATGVPADYQAQLDQQVAAPKQTADRLIGQNDAASQAVIDSYGQLGQTGGATTLPSVSSAGSSAAAALQQQQQNLALEKYIASQYNTNLNPGGFNQYGGYHTAQEFTDADTGRALQLAQHQYDVDRWDQAAGQGWQAAASPMVQGYGAAQDRLAAGQAAAGDPWTQGFLQLGANQVAADTRQPAPTIHTLAPPVTITPTNYAPPQAAQVSASSAGGRGNTIPVRAETAPPPAAPVAVGAGGDLLYQLASAGGIPGVPPEAVRQATLAALPSRDALTTAVQHAFGTPFNPATDTVGFSIDPLTGAVSGDPSHIYGFQQQAGQEVGVDPYILAGQFSPQEGQKWGADYLGAQNAYLQGQTENGERLRNGGYTDQQMQGRQKAMLQADPTYAAGANVAEQLFSANATQAAKDPNAQLYTPDDLMLFLERANAGGAPLSADVVRQLMTDYGPLFPTSGYAAPGAFRAQTPPPQPGGLGNAG